MLTFLYHLENYKAIILNKRLPESERVQQKKNNVPIIPVFPIGRFVPTIN